MQIVLGLSLTGYLLPWDQKGYWATRVATKMMGLVPVVGQSLQRIIVGGSEYGHHTLTRFFALHAGVLPALLTIFLTCTCSCSGVTVSPFVNRSVRRTYFWPEQFLRDAVACLAVAIVVLVLVVWNYPRMDASIPVRKPIGRRARCTGQPGRKLPLRGPKSTSCFCFKR